MSGFTGNDGSELAGGLTPGGAIKALSVDASGNLNVNASVSSGPTNITQLNGHTISDASSDGAALTSTLLTALGAYNGATIDRLIHDLKRLGVSLYGKGTNPGDTALLLETMGVLAGVAITEDVIRNLTIAGKAYSATTGKLTAPGSATLGFQLFNPANGTKNILIYSLIIANAGAGLHQLMKTAANVNSITGWTDSSCTITNNGANAAASTVTSSYSNTNVTGGLLGNAREVPSNSANSPVEVLTNGECIWLPAGAGSIAGIALYLNATGANAWGITCEYLEF